MIYCNENDVAFQHVYRYSDEINLSSFIKSHNDKRNGIRIGAISTGHKHNSIFVQAISRDEKSEKSKRCKSVIGGDICFNIE